MVLLNIMELIEDLVQQDWLKTPSVIKAFQNINRADFLPADLQHLANLNEALPIGYNQTISQPLVVAFMLELLQPEPGDKVLDIGSGSGWTSALLAHIVSGGELKSKVKSQKLKQIGKVIGVETIPELKKFGERNVAKYNFVKRGIAEFVCADGSRGYAQEAPYDKILCSAALKDSIPRDWKKQLKIGGRIVTPIKNSIWLFEKKSKNGFEQKEYPGFVFVPLIQK